MASGMTTMMKTGVTYEITPRADTHSSVERLKHSRVAGMCWNRETEIFMCSYLKAIDKCCSNSKARKKYCLTQTDRNIIPDLSYWYQKRSGLICLLKESFQRVWEKKDVKNWILYHFFIIQQNWMVSSTKKKKKKYINIYAISYDSCTIFQWQLHF